jgi:hypothetical protein
MTIPTPVALDVHASPSECVCTPGLPDVIFSFQKSQFGYILEGFGVKLFGIFCCHLSILLSLGIFCCNFEYLIVIGYILLQF